MGSGNTPKRPSFDYRPQKFSANELLGFNAGKSRFQLNTPGGLMALASGPMLAPLLLAQEFGSQHQTQRQLRQLRPGFEQDAETQGQLARQQSIASGTGGGGVQTASEFGARNDVLAQFAALRQALEAQRLAQQAQLYGGIGALTGSVIGGVYGGPAGATAGGQAGGAVGGAPFSFYNSFGRR